MLNVRNFLLAALDAADIGLLGPALAEVSLARGDTLFDVGEHAAWVFFPGNAVLSIVTVMQDGRCVETSTIGCESGVGLLDATTDEPAGARTFVQVSGSAFRLPASVLRDRFAESPSLRTLVLKHVRANSLQAEQNVACNVLHAIQQRLAKWLLMTADRTGSDRFLLTQDYMAVMAGAQRSTISATASAMRDAGLIRYTRGEVMILDREGLVRCACECYGDARGQFDALRR